MSSETYVYESTPEIVAGHQLGHAVMRYVLLGVMTDTWIEADGSSGGSEASALPCFDLRMALISLGGVVIETGYGLTTPTWPPEKEFNDVDDARKQIRMAWEKNRGPSFEQTETKLNELFSEACGLLKPYQPLIEELTGLLLKQKRISGEQLFKHIRRFERAKGIKPQVISE